MNKYEDHNDDLAMCAMTFGGMLKDFRIAKGLTLRDVGKLTDTDHTYIHRLETGAKNKPSPTVLRALMKAMHLTKHEQCQLKNALMKELMQSYGGMLY